MIDWDTYFVGIHPRNGLFIGKGKLLSGGKIRFHSKSGERTYEIINAVGRYMRYQLNKCKDKKKHYYGFDLPQCGKLVLIKPGYDFQVYRHYANAPEKPIPYSEIYNQKGE